MKPRNAQIIWVGIGLSFLLLSASFWGLNTIPADQKSVYTVFTAILLILVFSGATLHWSFTKPLRLTGWQVLALLAAATWFLAPDIRNGHIVNWAVASQLTWLSVKQISASGWGMTYTANPLYYYVLYVSGFWFLIGCFGLSLIATQFKRLGGQGGSSATDGYRSKSTVFGDARWGSWRKIKKGLAPAGKTTGIVLGENYDPRTRGDGTYVNSDRKTWGPGGKSPLITMDLSYEDGHSLIIAGSGGGKTAAYVIPTCFHYAGAMVVVDPDREAIRATRAAREAMGRTVREVSFAPGCGLDIIALMKPYYAADIMAFRDIAAAMLMMKSRTHFDEFYYDPGVDLVAALLEYFCMETATHPFTGMSEILGLETDKVKERYSQIAEKTKRENIAAVMSQMASQGKDFFQWFEPTLKRSLNWMVYPDIRDSLKTEPANAADPLDKDTDIFITIPSDRLKDMGGYIKLVLGVFAYHLKHRKVKDHRRLLLVDEAPMFGYVPLFETIRDTGRKHGIHLMLIFQSQRQIRQCYGDHAESAWASVAVRAYSAVEDIGEASDIAKIAGSYTADVEGASSGSNKSPFAVLPSSMSMAAQRSVQATALIQPDQIRTLPPDSQILIFRRQPPIICGKAIAFRRKQWARYDSPHLEF